MLHITEKLHTPDAPHSIDAFPLRSKPWSHACKAFAPNIVTPDSVKATEPFLGDGGAPQSTRVKQHLHHAYGLFQWKSCLRSRAFCKDSYQLGNSPL